MKLGENDRRTSHRTDRPRSTNTLLRMAQQGVSQIFGWRVLRQRGNSTLSLPCQGVGAAAGHQSYPDARNQRLALDHPFHLVRALPLLWFYQKAETLKPVTDQLLPSDLAQL